MYLMEKPIIPMNYKLQLSVQKNDFNDVKLVRSQAVFEFGRLLCSTHDRQNAQNAQQAHGWHGFMSCVYVFQRSDRLLDSTSAPQAKISFTLKLNICR